MYQYNPQFKKKKEKLLSLAMAILGVVLYASSQIPNAPFPGLIQILGICALAGCILLISMCILRSYSYELVCGEGEATDFVITEGIKKSLFWDRTSIPTVRMGTRTA